VAEGRSPAATRPAKSSGPAASKDARLDDAVQRLRAASTPLLQVLDPETQAAVRGHEPA
jgi:hypothetical protein